MTFWEQCLKRITEFPFGSHHYGHDTISAAQAAEAELDDVYSTMVPELCERLKRACTHLEYAHALLSDAGHDEVELELELEFLQELKKPL